MARLSNTAAGRKLDREITRITPFVRGKYRDCVCTREVHDVTVFT